MLDPERPVPRGLPARLTRPDVVVVGAGICGAACALELAERGATVLLLDRGEVCERHDRASARATCWRPTSDRGRSSTLALAGRALWEELGQRFAVARVTRKGGIVLFNDEGAGAFAELLISEGVGCELIERPDAIEPALAAGLPPCVLVPGELQVDPGAAARALVSAAVERGASFRAGSEVAALDPAAGAVLLADG